jgi:hypothetical protein
MTVMTSTAPGLRELTDDQLAEMFASDDEDTRAEVAAECDRRDRADRLARARAKLAGIRDEGHTAVFAQYLDADSATRGELLSREGKAAYAQGEFRDELALWSMPEERAMRYASLELTDYWLYVAPRITAAGYVRQTAAESRAARAAAMDDRAVTSEGATDGHDHDGQGLADDDAGSLRLQPATTQSEEAPGPGWPVPGGGRSSTDDGTEEQADPGNGGAGGPVHPGLGGEDPAPEEPDGSEASPESPDAEPAPEADCILDEVAAFFGDYLSATEGQITAMVLYAAATHAIDSFVTFGRMLWTSEIEECAKTLAMMMTASLSANPLDVAGTAPALQSALAEAANTPEQGKPTPYFDEISSIFGRSGLNSTRSLIADVLRKGYKRGAALSWSVNRVQERFSVYTPFLMTGLRVAVPRDIRSRCIVIQMRPGIPRKYFDVREAEPMAAALAGALACHVKAKQPELAKFRVVGIHPQLRNRKAEVWEALFAVAYHLGGTRWLNKCRSAFLELALDGSDQITLSPRYQAIRDTAEAVSGPLKPYAYRGFIGAKLIVAELKRLDNDIYKGRSDASLGDFLAESLNPLRRLQVRLPAGLQDVYDGADRARGYLADEITAAWDRIRPDDLEDAEVAEEVDPFDVTDDSDDDLDLISVTGGTGGTSVAGISAGAL